MKVIDILNAAKPGQILYSFEYFPDGPSRQTPSNLTPLVNRVDTMVENLSPSFVDITWGAGGSTSNVTLDLVESITKYLGIETQMHMTCRDITKDTIVSALERCKKSGIQNILALRGDPPSGEKEWKSDGDADLAYAADLVRFIKRKYGDYFGVAVAGYPEIHLDHHKPDQEGLIDFNQEEARKDIQYLKEKIDAGGDVIITQLFFDVPNFIKWVKECRSIGIDAPIIPGIIVPANYNGMRRMLDLCKTNIPQEMAAQLAAVKDDPKAFSKFSVDVSVQIITDILNADLGINAFHFYTLNQAKNTREILKRLGLLLNPPIEQPMPWRQCGLPARKDAERVRPVYWLLRTQSYLRRTEHWSMELLRGGRWGGCDAKYSEHVGVEPTANQKPGLRSQWGSSPSTESDISRVFELAHSDAGSVQALPWLMCSRPVREEAIRESIVRWCQSGLMVTNALPAADGVPSTDRAVGWGGDRGRIWQRAYVEFFCDDKTVKSLFEMIQGKDKGTEKEILVLAANANGDKRAVRNTPDDTSITAAVSWGMFPGQEVVQPLVVDEASFDAWSPECFALWIDQWRSLYESGTKPYELITNIKDTYWLVSICGGYCDNGASVWSLMDDLAKI